MLRIGSGAGFSGDRLEPAVLLAEKGNLDYLVLECLAERTIALAQKRKKLDPLKGYDPLLEKRMRLLLPVIKEQGVKVISNMGAANPIGGAEKIIEIAEELGISIKVAAVTGDDVFSYINNTRGTAKMNPPLSVDREIVSANAYLGADAIVPALQTEADIIITGRVADPSLFLAPMIHHFGWSLEDYHLLAKGTVVGHLLECGGQLTGGYFADPGKKDVSGLAEIGFPIAEVKSDGSALLTKLPSTGGVLNMMTAKEQLLYEVTDPNGYITPDVIADFTKVELKEKELDQILVKGALGNEKPDLLKVSVGYQAGFLGEGEISYAGENAELRARLAGEIVEERIGDLFSEIKIDYIGLTSAHAGNLSDGSTPYEVRLRVAGMADNLETASIVGEEIESLYTNGPAGGGGARKYTNEVLGIVSAMVPRDIITAEVVLRETVKI
ncbi:ABC transporter substrate-binding protein [Sporosarcina sp. P19]|uniref:acyclic terpene utilization AtuA family protein n=1 Tax=Sporosarcina sp. P19 TaxID=2048258 RepID=UPI000C16CAD0|nr:acyclic terpene utilization AtuA family protein [Sporosarcina sp. P19]PIC77045.1 ABC transporter substrate-binding protein [Sporosarcina sp. P19]